MKKDITPNSEEPRPFDPNHRRYSDLPFPSYRFIPGITPHPHTLKLNVSEGVARLEGAPRLRHAQPGDTGVTGPLPKNYLYGIDLFNFNYWWESHEAWETVWKTTKRTDEAGQFLQGLIQISAGMIKWWTKNPGGMKKLFGEGLEKLRLVTQENFMGIDLEQHIVKIDRFEKNPAAEIYPFIELG